MDPGPSAGWAERQRFSNSLRLIALRLEVDADVGVAEETARAPHGHADKWQPAPKERAKPRRTVAERCARRGRNARRGEAPEATEKNRP